MHVPAYRAVLFDLDGTLLETVPDLAESAYRMLDELRLPRLGEAAIASFVGRGIGVLVERCLRASGLEPGAAQLEQARAIFERCYAQESGVRSRPYAGVCEGLAQLAGAGIALGIVTNKAARFTEDLVDRMGWRDTFGVVVSGDTLAVRKPDPGPVLHACRVLGVTPAQTLMIGDSIHDVEAAHGAGCVAWCVPYGYNEGQPVEALRCERLVPDLAVAARAILEGS